MYEIEHGDHPDYKFPVHATYVGEHPEEHFTVSDAGGNNVEVDPGWVESRMHESHALIYTDGSIALTLYECSYAIWSLRDGKVIESQCWKRGEWQLTDESRAKINALKEQT